MREWFQRFSFHICHVYRTDHVRGKVSYMLFTSKNLVLHAVLVLPRRSCTCYIHPPGPTCYIHPKDNATWSLHCYIHTSKENPTCYIHPRRVTPGPTCYIYASKDTWPSTLISIKLALIRRLFAYSNSANLLGARANSREYRKLINSQFIWYHNHSIATHITLELIHFTFMITLFLQEVNWIPWSPVANHLTQSELFYGYKEFHFCTAVRTQLSRCLI